MANPIVTTVESDVKADATSELAKLKADYAKLLAESFSGKVVLIVGAAGVVVGFLLHFL
jgi:hypothetical protein